MTRRRAAGAAVAVVILLAAAGGCTSVSQRFPDYDPDDVWRAMVAVAESPHYDDWKVKSNDVLVEDEVKRIQVYRELRRDLRVPGQAPRQEEIAWRIEISLVTTDPPEVEFLSRGVGVPMHARTEGTRYFADVRDILLGLPTEADRSRELIDSLGIDETPPEPTETWRDQLEPATITPIEPGGDEEGPPVPEPPESPDGS